MDENFQSKFAHLFSVRIYATLQNFYSIIYRPNFDKVMPYESLVNVYISIEL